MFDTDGDGKINKNDLKIFLSEIFNEDKVDKTEFGDLKNKKEKEIPQPDDAEKIIIPPKKDIIDFNELINIVFGEIVFNEKRNYIDYDEFSRVLWTTTIDRNCVIDFE